ncbi:MAG TPA: helix-turn-helix domain-containing protein [Burkholderiaceae bacterium]|nr:helix-turn-helix domain-containing protein [Burkholderiaceae bacterium]
MVSRDGFHSNVEGAAPIFSPVRSLQRGLAVLEVVNQLRCGRLSEIVKRVDLPRPTVIRLLETLEAGGYIARNAANGVYEPSPRAMCLSEGFNSHGWLVTITTPTLRRLVHEIGWPSDVMILRGTRIIVVNSSRHMTALNVDRRFVGAEGSLAHSSGGRAYLAYCGETERKRLLQLILNVAERNSVIAEIERTRERGYAIRDPKARPEMNAIAIPVMVGPDVVCTLNCVYVSNASSAEIVAEHCLPALRSAAQEISETYVSQRAVRT